MGVKEKTKVSLWRMNLLLKFIKTQSVAETTEESRVSMMRQMNS